MPCWRETMPLPFFITCKPKLALRVRLPSHAGTLKSFLGLSASLMSTIYVAAFQPDGLSFLLFVACLPVVVGLATIPFLNQVPYLEACEIEDQHQYMTTGSYLASALCILFEYKLHRISCPCSNSLKPYASCHSSLARHTR